MSYHDLTAIPERQALQRHWSLVCARPVRDLFADDRRRDEQLTARRGGLYLDRLKRQITAETLRLLYELPEACGLSARIQAMLGRDAINGTENRLALRALRGGQIGVDGHDVVHDVVPGVDAVLDPGIDSLDQWGVELGKDFAPTAVADYSTGAEHARAQDSSTNALIGRARQLGNCRQSRSAP